MGPSDNPALEQQSQLEHPNDEAIRANSGAAELRAAQKAWLETRGINPESTPHLTMGSAELDMFRNAPANYQDTARSIYGVPPGEQDEPQYALVDLVSDDPAAPLQPKLLDVAGFDFGTAVDTIEGEQTPPAAPVAVEQPQPTEKTATAEDRLAELSANWGEVHEEQAVQEAWLELHGVDLAEIPRINFRSQQEFEMFRRAPANYQRYIKGLYNKTPEEQQDQINPQFALVTVPSDDSHASASAKLVVIAESDFGTTVDRERIDDTLQMAADMDPDNPNRPADAYKTVDIGDEIAKSTGKIQALAAKLMDGKTTDPLYSSYGDIGIRAGEPAPGQKDAYVWTGSPFTKSVELTIAFPSQYTSVCVVRGTRRDPANGKPGMAQIENPEPVLKIEGEHLAALQDIYQKLYSEPDYALTEAQREDRDAQFNGYLARQISSEAQSNWHEAQIRYDARQPQVRAREIPRS